MILARLLLSLALGAAPVGLLAAEAPPPWSQLSAPQREALAPLQRDWAGIDATRKQKWLEIAERFQGMSPEDRRRVQERMAQWARLSPQERARARIQFQEVRQLTAQEREARWQAYQSLPPEQKRQLAAQHGASAPAAPPRPAPAGTAPKTNIVPNPALAPATKPVTPIVRQAGPGATTTLVTQPPAPPAHQQTGMPKIAATPNFVDAKTLLPKRGPQGAATHPVPSASAASQ